MPLLAMKSPSGDDALIEASDLQEFLDAGFIEASPKAPQEQPKDDAKDDDQGDLLKVKKPAL